MINGRPAPIRGWTNGSMKCGPSAATTLFHGTSEEAAKSICVSQFRLPTSSAHGAMFGKGLYFADRAKKSHSYTTRNKDAMSGSSWTCAAVSINRFQSSRDH